MTITWKKVATGQFDALIDGQPSKWQVVNGSLGLSGRDTPNYYLPCKGDASIMKPGFGTTLGAAKEMVEKRIKKEAEQKRLKHLLTGYNIKL